MKPSSLFILLSQAALGAAEIKVDFDPALERKRVDVHIKVEEVVGHAFLKSQFSKPKDGKKNQGLGTGAVETSAVLDSRGVLELFAGTKRQSYCPDGYGYCAQFDRCCPASEYCCSYGYCIEGELTCCPNGPCDVGEHCCGQNHCYPEGGECCSDESYCSPGNHCYRLARYDYPVCCTDSSCTAYVEENGSTSYAPTFTTTHTFTTTRTQYYYWTATWWYWYYYWSYSYAIEASIVTSTQSTTSSVFSVYTTDADAASSYFSEMSETIALPTPAEATSLESLAGSTSMPSSSSSSSSSSSRSGSSDTIVTSAAWASSADTALPTFAAPSDVDDSPRNGDGDGEDGNGKSAARALWSQLDGFTIGFLTFGLGVGLVATLL
ncbi:hypothetical protein GGS20DRAFT_40520 [Poronia punctata]|nr:hypothetical protein GGS20DRAFT_40520 [Poronia punctata]